MTRAALLLACMCLLSGCEGLVVAFVGANMATVIHADKTIPDIALSNQRQKNCSLLHAARNEPYCQDPPPDQTEILADLAANRYCYRTLGGIDCYERPDFLASGLTQVDFTAGYLARPDGSAPMAKKKAPPPAMAEVPPPAAELAASAEPAAPEPKEAMAASTPPPAPMALAPDEAPTAKPPHPDRAALAQVPPLVAEPGQGTY